MPLVQWPLGHDRPVVEIMLSLGVSGQEVSRSLIADTGAGTRRDVFELILDEDDCLQCGGIPIHQVRLSGAYVGLFPVYLIDVRLPAIDFDDFRFIRSASTRSASAKWNTTSAVLHAPGPGRPCRSSTVSPEVA
jgi:hypothetical protein